VYFQLEHYDRVNPVTMKNGKLMYLNKMLEKSLIIEEDHSKYKDLIMKNEPINIVEIYNDNKHKDKHYFTYDSITQRDSVNLSKKFNDMARIRKTVFYDGSVLPSKCLYLPPRFT
jgi:hypothetical protein